MDVTPAGANAPGSMIAPSASLPSPSAARAAMPSITLPKGGGAIRGIDEKFSTNPVTGTASMAVPIATSVGRSGFGPELSLSYSSGGGNGPFGFGWTLSIARITRKTDKGLARYEDTDVFLLSGAEDLIPVYAAGADGVWVMRDGAHVLDVRTEALGTASFKVHSFRPRVEGLFARIERWTNDADPADVHWRSISRDNVLSVYGLSPSSRIFDPEDPERVFSWLLCESRDDRGNAVLYRYKSEDGAGVDVDRASERNRGAVGDRRRTANRYLKRIHYGNLDPLLDADGRRPLFLDNTRIDGQIAAGRWVFEVVLDYGEHDALSPLPGDSGSWPWRADAFADYRARFEVRTARLCQRILMFHHFDAEEGVGRNCLVGSTDFEYSHELDPTSVRNPVYTFLMSATQCKYRRSGVGYDRGALPPVEFEYSQPRIHDSAREVGGADLENLPAGLGAGVQCLDVFAEGAPGLLQRTPGAWYYKRNLSPITEERAGASTRQVAAFAPLERIASLPAHAMDGGQAQLMDVSGGGRPAAVVMDGPGSGVYEPDPESDGWLAHRPFASRPTRSTRDPNVRFIDLDGDGRADILVTEDDVFVWHSSLGTDGFGPAQHVRQAIDEEKGPRILFADTTQAIYLADLNGDGLADICRIRHSEVAYWANCGMGTFSEKITMDHAPLLDEAELFDQRKVLLFDADGSGTADLAYLHRDGVRLYFNQCGRAWSEPTVLRSCPRVDSETSVTTADLLGAGTTCLVWSSSLPGDARRPLRYIDLMADGKPHLLVACRNNLGAETRIRYAPSSRFYLQDRQGGKPWITRLPFPVHVVERVETFDHVSRNRYVTRYAYHHGHYDGSEREFRGFGMVEQWDSEEHGASTPDGTMPASNLDPSTHVTPMLTRTWFHTGVFVDADRISRQFEDEYYREGDPGVGEGLLTGAELQTILLPDTMLPHDLPPGEWADACRALNGMMLRREIYGLSVRPDGTPADEADRPFRVTEQSYTVRAVQARGSNPHGVFFAHPRESVEFNYERQLVEVGGVTRADPRTTHSFTLKVDEYGNVERSVSVAYRRRPLPDIVAPEQAQTFVTLTVGRYINRTHQSGWHRVGLPVESRTFEIVAAPEPIISGGLVALFRRDDIARLTEGLFPPEFTAPPLSGLWPSEQWDWRAAASPATPRLRLISHTRTQYRPDDLGTSANDPLTLLPLGEVESLALAGDSYSLAFTPGLISATFDRAGAALVPDAAQVLNGGGARRGGYVDLDGDGCWWTTAGRVFLSPDAGHTALQERDHARSHFFLPARFRDPFHTVDESTEGLVVYDPYDLLLAESRDALGNRVTAGERARILPDGSSVAARPANDYRVLQPRLLMDPNANCVEVAFDVLGLVVGTAVRGKPFETPQQGDSLTGFVTDLTRAQLDDLFDAVDPRVAARTLLDGATSRFVYDIERFRRTRAARPLDANAWQPTATAIVVRETHLSDEAALGPSPIRVSFAYSDGFAREIQQKVPAAPGPGPRRDGAGRIVIGADGHPEAGNIIDPRWITTGWVVFNAKGKPVRQFEPAFTDTHRFEFDVRVGVSAVLFYDPLDRVVTTLFPNQTYSKSVFDAWQQRIYDVSDTVAPRREQTGDPRTDPDVGGYYAPYFAAAGAGTLWTGWYAVRVAGTLGPEEKVAAERAAVHADTPIGAHVDALGRTFLTIAHNRFVRAGAIIDEQYSSRARFDAQGHQREAIDALARVISRDDFDLAGRRTRQAGMEAGTRWTLADVTGQPIRTWDSRGHNVVFAYDRLRRPTERTVRGTTAASDVRTIGRDCLVSSNEYGEQHPDAERLNLRTRVFRQSDSSGVATNVGVNPSGVDEGFDFKGNPLRVRRQLVSDYRLIADWSATPAPTRAASIFESATRFDALNRPLQTISPHDVASAIPFPVVRYVYNEAGLLRRVMVWLDRVAEPSALLDPTAVPASPAGVGRVDYDAKGRRVLVQYDNGAETCYGYDRLTFRLTSLYTRRGASFVEDCENPAPPPATIAAPPEPPPGRSCGLQNLRYTYDPSGNITHVRDHAQQTIYFSNRRVEPSASYTYDALYRLIEATGREHLGQGVPPRAHSHDDATRIGLLGPDTTGRFSPNDGTAMGPYAESYTYDPVGNVLEVAHRGTDISSAGWTRTYNYDEPSLLESGVRSNRLSATTLAGATATPERYAYDAHGNIVRLPHLGGTTPSANLHWDYADRLFKADLPGGGTAWYTYDAGGTRTRKVWEKSATATEDRVYLAGYEVFRTEDSASRLERHTLHVMDGARRVALVETRVAGTDAAPPRLVRYQYGNHLGSSSLELDEQAQIVSYEEYAPYGSTTYQAVRSVTDTPKRYRYTEKERDEETGLYYHGARYYAPWLARWTSSDPAGFVDGPCTYAYARGAPITGRDRSGLATDDPKVTTFEEFQDDLSKEAQKISDSPGDLDVRDRSSLDPKKPRAKITIDPLPGTEGKVAQTTPTKGKGELKTGEYRDPDVRGHHVEQSAAFKDQAGKDPMRRDALSVSQKEGALSEPKPKPGSSNSVAHQNAGKVQRAVDEGRLGKDVDLTLPKDPQGKLPEVSVKAGDNGTLAGGPSPWAEDVKGNHALLAGGVHPEDALNATLAASDERKAAGMLPTRIPVPGSKWQNVKEGAIALADKAMKSKAVKVVVAVAPIFASTAAKAAPAVGTVMGAADVANEAQSGSARRATLAAIGMSEIPIVSQAADIGLGVEDAGWVAKDIIDPEMKAEQWFYDHFLK